MEDYPCAWHSEGQGFESPRVHFCPLSAHRALSRQTPLAVFNTISAPRPGSTNDAEHLLELYWERVYRFAALITRYQHESADIAQEALLKVLRQRHIPVI